MLVGAGTVRDERYGPLISDRRRCARRAGARASSEQPLAVIASCSLELDPTLPLLADPASRVVVLTRSPGELAAVRGARRLRAQPASAPTASRELRERFGVAVVLCEGGPSLAGASLAAER